MTKKQTVETVAEWLGMTTRQAEDLRYRINDVKTRDGGWGRVEIIIQRRYIWKFEHVHSGEPTTYKVDEHIEEIKT